MKKESLKVALPAALAVLSVVPAGAMPSVCGWLFIVFAITAAVLLYKKLSGTSGSPGLSGSAEQEDPSVPVPSTSLDSQAQPYQTWFIAGCLAGMFVMLALSVHAAGSAPAFGRRLLALFKTGQDRPGYVQVTEIKQQNEEILQGRIKRAGRLTEFGSQLHETGRMLDVLQDSLRESHFWENRADPGEVAGILEFIKTQHEKDMELLPDVKTDAQDAELFYKMRLSSKRYQYCNIIRAMEAYGIQCGEMAIDEQTLMGWDAEMIFAQYRIITSLWEDAVAGIEYEEARLYYYKDYRMKDKNENSDTFDYEGWRWQGETSARKTWEKLEGNLEDYYRKWYANFNGS